MSILLKCTLDCNMQCAYCYEHDTRSVGRHRYYDLDAMLATAQRLREQTGDTVSLHGGECLLLAKRDLDRLLKALYEMQGSSGIQTNASLIDDDHIRMFKKYKTHVGVSVDGLWPLNRGRTDEAGTNKILTNIRRMREANVSVGPIIVLSTFNAETPEQRELLKEFLLDLKAIGITGGRLNLVQHPKCELTPEQAREAYLDLGSFVLAEPGFQFQPFRDIVDNLCGFGLGTCVFSQCPFYATPAGKAIMGDGSLSSCLKTAVDGVPFIQSDRPDYTRYDILRAIPREQGGCGGCRYWRICYGNCPTEGENGDWRNKSRFCDAWYATYEMIEKRLKALLPNIQLITDETVKPEDEKRDYDERKCERYQGRPFGLMDAGTTGRPSTWRGQAKRSRQSQQQCRSGTGHADQAHGDYSRHGDSAQ